MTTLIANYHDDSDVGLIDIANRRLANAWRSKMGKVASYQRWRKMVDDFVNDLNEGGHGLSLWDEDEESMTVHIADLGEGRRILVENHWDDIEGASLRLTFKSSNLVRTLTASASQQTST